MPYEFHAFEDNGEYAGYPDDTKDQMWQDLFSCKTYFTYSSLYVCSQLSAVGMIRISEEESKNLVQPTFKIPNTDEYLIELEVFHQLHCLNQLRQAFYPERWPHLWQYTPEGKIDYAGRQYGHWGMSLSFYSDEYLRLVLDKLLNDLQSIVSNRSDNRSSATAMLRQSLFTIMLRLSLNLVGTSRSNIPAAILTH